MTGHSRADFHIDISVMMPESIYHPPFLSCLFDTIRDKRNYMGMLICLSARRTAWGFPPPLLMIDSCEHGLL